MQYIFYIGNTCKSFKILYNKCVLELKYKNFFFKYNFAKCILEHNHNNICFNIEKNHIIINEHNIII